MPDAVDVSIPRRWLAGMALAGALVGFGAAFAVAPVVTWLVNLAGEAPGPLRLVAGLPLGWAIPVLSLVGLGVGSWFAAQWHQENGTVTVGREGLTVHRAGSSRHITRDRVGGVYTDGRDLVVVDGRTNEVLRVPSDRALVPRLRAALGRFGYPWQGTTDPHEQAFTGWIDGSGRLDDRQHDLLRARQRALTDKRAGAAEDARDELRTLGVVVRDREDAQQYRLVPGSG